MKPIERIATSLIAFGVVLHTYEHAVEAVLPIAATIIVFANAAVHSDAPAPAAGYDTTKPRNRNATNSVTPIPNAILGSEMIATCETHARDARR